MFNSCLAEFLIKGEESCVSSKILPIVSQFSTTVFLENILKISKKLNYVINLIDVLSLVKV